MFVQLPILVRSRVDAEACALFAVSYNVEVQHPRYRDVRYVQEVRFAGTLD